MKAYTASMCVNLCELGENWIEKFETWKHCFLIISCLATVYRAEYSVELPDCRNQVFSKWHKNGNNAKLASEALRCENKKFL